MIHLLFTLLYLFHVAQATSTTTNSTSSACPELDESYRSIWSILGSCALTLGICLWHTVHFDVPKPGEELLVTLGRHALYTIWGFLAPEVLFANATEQWIRARQKVKNFRDKGYEWSMTHSQFAENGGFVYQNREGKSKVIDAIEFLNRCEAGEIANPLVTEVEIKDKSKSDAISKAVFAIQLVWFMLQVSARHFVGLSVTLVELDTFCMAVIAIFYLLLWWSKPLNAGFPHIFYESQELTVYSREELSSAWEPQPGFIYRLLVSFQRCTKKAQSTNDEEKQFLEATEVLQIKKANIFKHDFRDKFRLMHKLEAMFDEAIQSDFIGDNAYNTAYLSAWLVLGALHLAAWNYAFPTEKEMFIWRGAAVGLTTSALIGMILVLLEDTHRNQIHFKLVVIPLSSSVVACRVVLVVLMFLSLRELPCSANQTISWVEYIPHL